MIYRAVTTYNSYECGITLIYAMVQKFDSVICVVPRLDLESELATKWFPPFKFGLDIVKGWWVLVNVEAMWVDGELMHSMLVLPPENTTFCIVACWKWSAANSQGFVDYKALVVG